MSDGTFQFPGGLICVTTHGVMQSETAKCVWEARSFCEERGMKTLKWIIVPGALVDKARNDACRAMLRENYGFLLMLDADMTWEPNAVALLIQTAYGTHPWADVVGGYANLRGELAIPTIDTGTGTWESHYPGNGVVEVIRTGAAFLLVKRHVCERIPDPWFAMRVPMRPIDAFAEVDNFSRIKMDGANPLRQTPEWTVLETIAQQDPTAHKPNFVPAEVGEDSGFCDRVKAAGMRIVVDTNIVTGHLHQTVVTWQDHKKAMENREREHRMICGLLQ